MTDSLSTPPVAGVLADPSADAARDRGGRPQGPKGRFRDGPGSGRDQGVDRVGERERFARARHSYLAVSPSVGRLLYQLVRLRRATAVIEFGTSFGISTLHLGAAVLDNGGGTVIGTEYESNKVEATRRSVTAAGLDGVVEVRAGDAAETLARDLPDTVDLLSLDGAKSMYLDVLALVEPRLGAGSVVVADNAARAEGFLGHLEDAPGWLPTFLEGEDLVIALRTG